MDKFNCLYLEDEIRMITKDGSPRVEGYGVVFGKKSNVITRPGYRFTEIVSPDVEIDFADDMVALREHDQKRMLGRSSSGTFRYSRDSRGIAYEVDLPDTQDARDLAVQMERGDIRGSSFRMKSGTVKDRWDRIKSIPQRTIDAFGTTEFSIVGMPAYNDAVADIVRSMYNDDDNNVEETQSWRNYIDALEAQIVQLS